MDQFPKIMKVIQLISCFMAITLALTLFLTPENTNSPPTQPPLHHTKPTKPPIPSKRVGRFLQQNQANPRAALDHCSTQNTTCDLILEGRNTTCCNDKCIDLGYDSNNCGACRRTCDVTDVCCGGQCVNLAFDKRHCGSCNNTCKMNDGLCNFGVCDYA